MDQGQMRACQVAQDLGFQLVSLTVESGNNVADPACSGDFYDHLSEYKGIAPSSQVKLDSGSTATAAVSPYILKPCQILLLTPTSIQEEAPEPIKNVFEGLQDIPEEKTMAPVGPAYEVQMLESTETAPIQTADAEIPEDTRVPVGLDAGAPQVTAAVEDEGGWHGGAEEQGGRDVEEDKEADRQRAPLGAKVVVEEMELDDVAKQLADEALRADGGP